MEIPADVVQETFTLSSPATIGIQTWGFGGGTNAAGDVISPGGTDAFLGTFLGTGGSATILTDGSSNPFGKSEIDLCIRGAETTEDQVLGEPFVWLAAFTV